jgi:hypothetical protein
MKIISLIGDLADLKNNADNGEDEQDQADVKWKDLGQKGVGTRFPYTVTKPYDQE